VGLFVCITGVSGSGKSTLINDTLYNAVAHHLYGSAAEPAEHGISHPLPSAGGERSSRTKPGTTEAARPAPGRGESRPAAPAAEPTQRPATPDPAQGAARPQKDRDH